MKRLVLAAVIAMLVPRVAHADAPSEPTWYGWQILAADTVASAGLAASFRVPSGARAPLLVGGLMAFVAGGPLVHFANGRGDAVASSMLLRFLAPLVTVLALGPIRDSCQHGSGGIWSCPIGADTTVTLALVTPIAIASIVDAARASTRPGQPVPAQPILRPMSRDMAWAPTLAPTSAGAGATLGLVGRF